MLGLLERFFEGTRKGPASEAFFVAQSFRLVYDSPRGTHAMDFWGRVTEGSQTNCVLSAQNRPGSAVGAECVSHFGKSSKKLYAMDFAYPLTLLQASCIAVACFVRVSKHLHILTLAHFVSTAAHLVG